MMNTRFDPPITKLTEEKLWGCYLTLCNCKGRRQGRDLGLLGRATESRATSQPLTIAPLHEVSLSLSGAGTLGVSIGVGYHQCGPRTAPTTFFSSFPFFPLETSGDGP